MTILGRYAVALLIVSIVGAAIGWRHAPYGGILRYLAIVSILILAWMVFRQSGRNAVRWGWPMVVAFFLVACLVTVYRLVDPAQKEDYLIYSILYVAIVFAMGTLIMIGVTQVWTYLSLGLLCSFLAIMAWEFLESTAAKGWITFTETQVAWVNDVIVAGLVVGATFSLVGMFGNMNRGGALIQPWRWRPWGWRKGQDPS